MILIGAACASGFVPARPLRSSPRSSALRMSAEEFDYDIAIVGCGVGGHGAALHARSRGLKTLVLSGGDVGGTCVNRGCVPSKALLAAAGRVREMSDEKHLGALGIQVDGKISYDRAGVAAHASQLASKVKGGLENSLKGLGVDVLEAHGEVVAPQTLKAGDRTIKARDIILAPGSVPFVPPGIETDGKTVFTSDEALELSWVPEWVAIIGSGYIGLEFSDVYTALGSDVTFIEAMPKIMPGFDGEIAKQAERILINPRNIDYVTNVLATKVTPGIIGEKPVTIELSDFKTREVVDVMEVDACLVATGRAPFTDGLGLESIDVETQRGFVPVNERMQALDKDGEVIEGVWCIGDANGKMMLAHAASAQGIAAIECMQGRDKVLNHNSVPAACFTHPEVSFVGMTEEQARAKGEEEGFEVTVKKTSFKANSKALAEKEADGMAKLIYRSDTQEILGMWIMGLHAADLIHEASNAVNQGMKASDLKFAVHAHPTLAEVVDEVFKQVETHA